MRSPKYAAPESRRMVLRRKRLLDLLYEHIDQPLQLICAPAGYGKSTLLADLARDTELTVCWYAVDELDSDPRSFLHHVAESIRSAFPMLDEPEEPTHYQSSDLSLDWRSRVIRLIDGIKDHVPEYFLLVIDDFHLVSNNPAVADIVDLLVQRLPDNCRLIISAREIPRLTSLPRLISQRRVSGLGTAELRFTSEEIRVLLERGCDLEISAEEAQRLEMESEGWITSILLTTHSLWKGLLGQVLVERGRHSLLFDYIASEVFSQQPPLVQRFLLNTSVCNEFDAELGDLLAGTDASGNLVDEIESRNLFVTRLGDAHPWYGYHHLFRDFLRNKLKREDPSGFAQLSVKAGDYFSSKREPRRAIHYYIQGAEFGRALDLLELQAEALSHEGLWETLGNWMEQIPEEQRAGRPTLFLYLSRVYQLRGRNDEAIRLLNSAMDVFKETGERALEAQALMRRSFSLSFKGAYQMAVRDARSALALAQSTRSVVDQADAHNHLGSAYAQQGKFRRAEKEFRAAIAC